MNTTFKILWFEDELAWFNMEKLRIDDALKSHCLTSSITRKNGDDIDVDELTGNDYDLILMDFKLANGVTGDGIVSQLRENNILTDILFYSSEEETMLSAIRSKMPPIDGVYLTKRDYISFTTKVENIIKKIVKRSEDVINLRGFVLDNTSDFEVRIKEILNICWQKLDDTQKSLIDQVSIDLLKEKQNQLQIQVSKALSKPHVLMHANNVKYLLTINDKLEILEKILEILGICSEQPLLKSFKKYYVDQISVYRNPLGHVKAGEKTINIKGKDIEINQDLHRLLRKNITEMDDKIKLIETYITQM